MRPRWTTTAPPTGNGRWLTSRLCALGLMVEEDDAAEILGRASYAGFSPEAGASAIAATNIVLDRGQIREEIRSGSHQRYFRACRARGYETWTVTTFGGSQWYHGHRDALRHALSPLLSGDTLLFRRWSQ